MTIHLNHRELLSPKRRAVKLLGPNEIPVHPSVYHSDFAYMPEFIDEVRRQVPESMRKDLECIEDVLDRDPYKSIDVGQTGATLTRDAGDEHGDDVDLQTLAFKEISHLVSSKRKSVDVAHFSSNIALDSNSYTKREVEPDTTHPMSRDKLMQYSLIKEGLLVPFWYVHNHLDKGELLELYFRNFAIVFNNLGLKKLKLD